MKTAARVFIILGMVCGFWMIVPLIVGAIALGKLSSAKSKDELLGVSICTLLFCSVLGGVFMLCLSDSEFEGAKTEPKTDTNVTITTVNEPKASAEDVTVKLEKLNKLRQNGVITEEEYEAKKKELIGKI